MQPLMASPCPGIKYRVLPQPSRPYLVWSLTTCLTSYPGTSSLVHTYKHRTIPSAPGKSQACSHLRAFAHAAPSVYSLLPLLKPGSFGSFRFPLKHHLLRDTSLLLHPQATCFPFTLLYFLQRVYYSLRCSRFFISYSFLPEHKIQELVDLLCLCSLVISSTRNRIWYKVGASLMFTD